MRSTNCKWRFEGFIWWDCPFKGRTFTTVLAQGHIWRRLFLRHYMKKREVSASGLAREPTWRLFLMSYLKRRFSSTNLARGPIWRLFWTSPVKVRSQLLSMSRPSLHQVTRGRGSPKRCKKLASRVEFSKTIPLRRKGLSEGNGISYLVMWSLPHGIKAPIIALKMKTYLQPQITSFLLLNVYDCLDICTIDAKGRHMGTFDNRSGSRREVLSFPFVEASWSGS